MGVKRPLDSVALGVLRQKGRQFAQFSKPKTSHRSFINEKERDISVLLIN